MQVQEARIPQEKCGDMEAAVHLLRSGVTDRTLGAVYRHDELRLLSAHGEEDGQGCVNLFEDLSEDYSGAVGADVSVGRSINSRGKDSCINA